MRLVFVILLVSALVSISEAQIVLNVHGDIMDKENFFNREFISNNKIKSISGTFMIKREGESIKDLPGVISYGFDESGLLQELYQESVIAGFRDTIHILYKYTAIGTLRERIEYRHGVYNSHHLEYDDRGRLEKESHYRVRDLNDDPKVFSPGKDHLVSSTIYSWRDINDTTTEKTSYNNNSLPFQKETVCTSKDGFLINCKSQFVTTKDSKTTLFKYNTQSWVSEKSIAHSKTGREEVYKYKYDSLGMLLKESYYVLESEQKFKELLYKADGMLEAIIEKDMSSGEINICKYSTMYY